MKVYPVGLTQAGAEMESRCQRKIKVTACGETVHDSLVIFWSADIFRVLFGFRIFRNLRKFDIEAGIIFDISAGLGGIVQGAGQAGKSILQHIPGIPVRLLAVDPALNGIRLQGGKAVLAQGRFYVKPDDPLTLCAGGIS